jgi:glucose uptake protein GlcU
LKKIGFKKLIIIGFWAVVLLTQFATVAYALDSKIYPDNPGLPGSQQSDAKGLVGNIINIILPVVGIVAVLFIIIGGFQLITSRGNEEQAESGKKTLTNAIIGLVVILLSYVIVNVIINSLK